MKNMGVKKARQKVAGSGQQAYRKEDGKSVSRLQKRQLRIFE